MGGMARAKRILMALMRLEKTEEPKVQGQVGDVKESDTHTFPDLSQVSPFGPDEASPGMGTKTADAPVTGSTVSTCL